MNVNPIPNQQYDNGTSNSDLSQEFDSSEAYKELLNDNDNNSGSNLDHINAGANEQLEKLEAQIDAYVSGISKTQTMVNTATLKDKDHNISTET